jgi:hypothetical protein
VLLQDESEIVDLIVDQWKVDPPMQRHSKVVNPWKSGMTGQANDGPE